MSRQLLYERWLSTANSFQHEIALIDDAADRSWSFGELLRDAQTFKQAATDGPIAFPRGNEAEFIFTLLAAWRRGMPACPLEPGQSAPTLANLPCRCAHVKITSATSGAPKCILFTGEQLAADAENIVTTMGLRPESPNLACISLAHSYGFSNLVLPLLLHGIPLVLAAAPLPEVIARAAKRAPAISLPAVPALWKTWHEAGALPSNLQLAISAGAPLSLSIEEAVFSATGTKIHNFYGSSECGGIAYDRSNTPRSDAACAGSPMENVRLSVSAERTLVVESAAVGETYWPKAAPNLGTGRFETSDLAEIRDGTVFLRGRIADVLNVAGRKTSPEIIEAALRAHPSVLECVVFGIPEADGRGEAIVAALQTRGMVPIGEMTAFLSRKIPAWQIPRHWWFTDQIGVNSRGKIARAEWKRRFMETRNQ